MFKRKWWGRGSFALTTVCLPLPWVEVEEGLICIDHSVSPYTLGGGGGGAHLHWPQCVPSSLGRGGGERAHLPLGWRWIGGMVHLHDLQSVSSKFRGGGNGLICIIHSVSSSTLDGGGGGAHLHFPHCVSIYGGGGGGSYFHHPQCVLGIGGGDGHLDYFLGDCWRSKWLIYIMYKMSPSTGHWGGGWGGD